MQPKPAQALALVALYVGLLACNLQAAPASPVTSTLEPTEDGSIQSATPAVEPSATATIGAPATSTATQGPPPQVTIVATGGRLNVRRGPGPEYDTVGSFLDGQSSIAVARNESGTWVVITVPNQSNVQGWITLETKYTKTSGDWQALPVRSVDPALPAYIRNCTGREMLVNPTASILLPQGSAPDNQLQFFPGEYTIVDLETEKEVAGITVYEGKTVDIKQDSSGKKFSCP